MESTREQVEREVEQAELREQIARKASDAERLDSIGSDDLVVDTSNLLLTRRFFPKRIQDGNLKFSRFERKIEARCLGNFRREHWN